MTPAIQERFDALARGLATGRLTRWEIIKGLGAGVLLGVAGLLRPWSASFAEAQTPAVKKAPVGSLSNPRKDSVRVPTCWEFNDYIQHTGVTDEEGKNHPTLGGFTSYKCGIEHNSYEYRVTPKSKPGHVCISVTKLNVTFEVSYKVTVIVWRPPTPQSAGCRAEETYFQESLVDHERVHVGHMKNAVAAANSRWKKNPPKFGLTCARIEQQVKPAKQQAKIAEQQAKIALEKKIHREAVRECARIDREIQTKGKEFDRNHTVSEMDCNQCT